MTSVFKMTDSHLNNETRSEHCSALYQLLSAHSYGPAGCLLLQPLVDKVSTAVPTIDISNSFTLGNPGRRRGKWRISNRWTWSMFSKFMSCFPIELFLVLRHSFSHHPNLFLTLVKIKVMFIVNSTASGTYRELKLHYCQTLGATKKY